MTLGNDLAIRRDDSAIASRSLPARSDWETMKEMGPDLHRSGMLPDHIKTPQAAIAIMLKGWELGLSPMYSLTHMSVIKGKPTCGSEMMLGLIYNRVGPQCLEFVESNATVATVSYWRPGFTGRREHSFTIEDARKMGLTGNEWTKQPATMLRWRCVSAVARMAFPDVIGGLYTHEEMGGRVSVEADGHIVLAAQQDAPERNQQPRQQRPHAIPAPVAEVIDNDTDEVVEARAQVVETFMQFDAEELVQWASEVTSAKALAQLKESIIANGYYNSNDRVMSAYTSTWERVTGQRAPSRDEAASMGQQASFVK